MQSWSVGLLLIPLSCVSSYYLEAPAPVTYCDNTGDPGCQSDIKLFVDKLTSEETAIPYEYHE